MQHQENLIIWDPVAKVEHFVRSATFSTQSQDLAFIAPTPSVPEIKKVDQRLWGTLASALWKADPNWKGHGSKADESAAADDTTVIQEVDVAGFHAVTLMASNTNGLAAWLKTHGYPFSESARTWSAHYISKGWYLTAFKVQTGHKAADTGTVRMSFNADKPFNPYYVPKDNAASSGMGLDLYFVSTAEYKGKIGGASDWIDPQITFDADEELRSDLADQMKLDLKDIPAKAVVSYYHDSSFPRANIDDIYFSPKPPVPYPYYRIFFFVSIFFSWLAAWFGWKSKKERKLKEAQLAAATSE